MFAFQSSATGIQVQKDVPGAKSGLADDSKFFKPALAGRRIMEFENKAWAHSKAELESGIKAYSDFAAAACLALDSSLGKNWQAAPSDADSGKKLIISACADLASFVWSNFAFSKTIGISEAFCGLASSGSGKATLDCDTSSIVMADILGQFGLDCSLCVVPNHGLLKASYAGATVWFETTTNSKKGPMIFSFYSSEDEVKAKYGTVYYEEKISPDMPTLYLNRGTYLLSGKNLPNEAVSDFDKAILENPCCIGAFLNRAIAKNLLGKNDEAEADLRVVMDANPMLAEAHMVMALVHHAQNRDDDALADLERAVKIDPNDFRIYTCGGFIRYGMGDYSGAITDYDTATMLILSKMLASLFNPQGSDFAQLKKEVVSANIYRGISKARIGQDAEALKDFDSAIKLDDSSARAYKERAEVRLKTGDNEGAERDRKKAEELEGGPAPQ